MTKNISLLIKKVVNTCETCIKFREPNPRPVVAFTKTKDFNQTVSADLQQLLTNLWYMHFVDEFTCYSAAVIVENKSVCHKAFIKYWTSIFGAPKNIFSNNGGEFIGDIFIEMCERFNIKVQNSASFSPWSNGEWHYQILTNIMLNVKTIQRAIMTLLLPGLYVLKMY